MAGMKLIEGNTYAALAAADLSSSINRFVKIDSNGEVVLAGDNEKPVGVLFEAAELGGAASMMLLGAGIAKVSASAAIAAGARVACAANGQVKTSTGTNPVGIALGAANGAGSIISVALVG